MKTTLTYKDGLIDAHPDAAPVIDPEADPQTGGLYLVDAGNVVLSEEVPLATILRVEFEP